MAEPTAADAANYISAIGADMSIDSAEADNIKTNGNQTSEATTDGLLYGSFEAELLQDGKFVSPARIIGSDEPSGYITLNSYLAGGDTPTNVYDEIYAGLRDSKGKIDISKYSIETGELPAVFEIVMNGHADLFYVSRGMSYSYYSNGLVRELIPNYKLNGSALTSAKQTYENGINNIISKTVGMSELEKVLFLHDYICLNSVYDSTLSKFDAYTMLTQKTGVCQAYTLLYSDLLQRVGVEVTWTTSITMNHIWNLVKVGGKWYHVDVTHDDPLMYEKDNDRFGWAYHGNFLMDDAGISATGHKGWETAISCTSNIFKNSFIKSITSAFVKLGDTWYCTDADNKSVLKCNLINLTSESVRTFDFEWLAWNSTMDYYPGLHSSIGVYGGKLILNSSDTFYKYDPIKNELTAIGSPNCSTGRIYGFIIDDKTVTFALATSPNEEPTSLYSFTIPALTGDLNDDGTVDEIDTTLLRLYLTQNNPEIAVIENADINKDGVYDLTDLLRLRRYTDGVDATLNTAS